MTMRTNTKMHIVPPQESADSIPAEKIPYDALPSKDIFSEPSIHAYKLHLSLDLSELGSEEMDVLKKYGKVEQDISRDIIVSGQMTLHALHYAIQRVFGWQNSHLHHYQLTLDTFEKLVGNKFMKWKDLCGLYFRFPSDDYEDWYWDDDYEEEVYGDIRKWLKSKYTQSYTYGGFQEYTFFAQHKAEQFAADYPILRVGPTFDEYLEGKRDSRDVPLTEATIKDVSHFLEMSMGELLERLTIREVLDLTIDNSAYAAIDAVVDEMKRHSDENEKLVNTMSRLSDELDELLEKRKTKNTLKKITEVRSKLDLVMDRLVMNASFLMSAVDSELDYEYDFGAGWKVKITCAEIYHPSFAENSADDAEQILMYDSKGCPLSPEESKRMLTCITKDRPYCVAADGLPVLDDVGGPFGYVNLLRGLHWLPQSGPYEDKYEAQDWARSMGWTGRLVKAENIL